MRGNILALLSAMALTLGGCSNFVNSVHQFSTGHQTRVVAWARERFEGFIDEVQRHGYRVGAPGCLSSGHMRHSKHRWGGACDLFVQVARNRTRLRLPPNHMEIAKSHGLITA
jgi:hypothetical protein